MNNTMQIRREIYNLMISGSNNINSGVIDKICEDDLRLMFELYDPLFLNDWFKNNFKGQMKFSLSRRMTKSAGMTLYPKKLTKLKPEATITEIRIGVEFLFHFNLLEGSRRVCGIEVSNSLQALQLVFEHELCHAIELIKYGGTSCRGDRFKMMALELFGHTMSHHELPTNREIASSKLGLNIGDTVAFDYYGNLLQGLLYKINKRAIVMVRDDNGSFADKEGKRYSKYYIPLEFLKK